MRADQLRLLTSGERPAAEAPGRLFGGLPQLPRGVRIAARQPWRCFLKRQSGCRPTMLHGSGVRVRCSRPGLGSCGADVMRASKLQYAVQGTDGDGYLGRPTAIRARVQTIADHPFVGSDCSLDPGALVRHIVGAQGMEVLMARKPPVPVIPPVPPRRSRGAAMGVRLAPAPTAQPKQSQQPELPDLLEAFWGDGTNARGAIPRARGRHGGPPDTPNRQLSGAPCGA
jgi:hypothetical protein